MNNVAYNYTLCCIHVINFLLAKAGSVRVTQVLSIETLVGGFHECAIYYSIIFT